MADRNQWLKLVHVARRKLALEDDEYRDILERVTGKRSAGELDVPRLRKVVDEFGRLGFVSTTQPKPTPPPSEADWTAPVTPAQKRKLIKLYEVLGWKDAERQRGFSKRQCGHPWPQTRRDAQKVIDGLKVIVRREEAKAKKEQAGG